MTDQAQRLRDMTKIRDGFTQQSSGKKNPKSIAVTSGKGGVGKSNIALFLAVTFARAQKKVLLLDADLGLANVHILLGIAPAHSLHHYIEGTCSLKDAITRAPGGFDIIPGASGVEKYANGDAMHLMRVQQGFSLLEPEYDVLIIDTGAGIGTTVTHFASNADCALIIMTPEPTSLADAYAMVKVLNEKGCSNLGIVVNMAGSEREGIETFDRLNTLVVKFLKRSLDHFGTLPYSDMVGRYVKKQACLLTERGDSVFGRKMQIIMRRIYGVSSTHHKSFFTRILES